MVHGFVKKSLLLFSCLALLACQLFITNTTDRAAKAEATRVKQFARDVLARLSEDKLFSSPRPGCGVLAMTSDQNIIIVVSKGVRLAGLRPGDIIRAVDDQPVTTHNDLREELAKKGLPDAIKLRVDRKERRIQYELKCQDTREFKRLTKSMYSMAADGKWDECISRSNTLEQLLAPAYFIADMRTKCNEAKRMMNGRIPSNTDARMVYDTATIMIKEAEYSGRIEKNDRDKALSAISWLRDNGFKKFSDDLRARLDQASHERFDH